MKRPINSNLDEKTMAARIIAIRELLSNTKTVSVELQGHSYQVEYLVIPAGSEIGKSLTPIFNYPGGKTDLAPCIEPFIYMDRKSIVISPLGYGKSSDPCPEVWSDNLHGAEVCLQVLRALRIRKVALYGHSNAAPIILQAALKAREYGIEVEEIILVNPIGLRRFSWLWPSLAYSISGGLSRIASWFHTHPYKLVKNAYRKTKHPLSFRKIAYELAKSSEGQAPFLLLRMRIQKLRIPLTVVQSRWDWGLWHMPWTKSNEAIFHENVADDLLKIKLVSGSHNVTLGPNSKWLAEILENSLITALSLAIIFLHYAPAIPFCIAGAFG